MKTIKCFIILSFLSYSIYAQETISNANFSLTFNNLGSGISLTSIQNSGTQLLNTAANPNLFTLSIHNSNTNTDETITSGNNWNSVSFINDSNALTITLEQPNNTNLPNTLTVTVTVQLNEEKSTWDITVTGLGANCSLMETLFPQININAVGNDTFLYPLYSGRLTENPGDFIDYFDDTNDASDNNVGLYPRGWGTTMQFFAYYNANYGIYFGFHDPDASTKYFGVKNMDGGINIQCKIPSPNKTSNGNDWDFPGVFELDLFNGDWYDAAKIYKEWVSSESNYWPEDSANRTIRQHKAGDIGVWLTTSDFNTLTMTQMETNIQTAIDFFDVPVGMSFYNWNYSEYDHFYPNYFPERTGLSTLIANLQSNNDFTVMPYINSRLWDTGIGGGDAGDAEAATYFNTDGYASATKEEDNSLFIETFQSNDFAVMCPTQTDWQDLLTDTANQITGSNGLGASAIYLDMAAASGPKQCMDTSHGHTLGGGSFWKEGYQQMFENIHNTIPTDRFIAVEGGNDFIANQVDAFMVQGWQTDHQIPAWQAIYTGKVQLFGTKTGGSHYPFQKFYGRLAQGFAYGVQTGRQYMWLAINPSANADKQMAANFVKQLSQMRYKLRNFMSYGEMERPLTINGAIPNLTYDVYDWGGHHGLVSVTNSAIQTSTWKNNDEVVVLFVNARIQSPAGTSGGNIAFSFDFDASDYGFVGDVTVQELTATNDDTIETESNSFTKNVNLENLDVVAYKITGTTLNINNPTSNNIIVYPNPTTDFLTIKSDVLINEVRIFNNLGQLVQEHKNLNQNRFSVKNLTKGLYYVSFLYKGSMVNKKVVIN